MFQGISITLEFKPSALTSKGLVLKCLKIDHFMNWWHPPTLVLSLFPSLDPQRAWREEEKGRNPIFQRIAWIVSTLLASPFTQFESWMERGAIVTFYAVKK